jgi:hypothetical protein
MNGLENYKNLYYIENVGCDDETCGLADIPDDVFPKFKEIIENLNKNSTYGCMPKIQVYKVDSELFREHNYDDGTSDYLYLGDKVYVFRESLCRIREKMERVV